MKDTKGSSNHSLIIVLLVILLVFLTVVALLVMNSLANQYKYNGTDNKTKIELTSWKTYTDDIVGYTLKYPPDYITPYQSGLRGLRAIRLSPSRDFKDEEISINIFSQPVPSDYTLEQFIKEQRR